MTDEFSIITDKIQQKGTQNLQSRIIELWDLKPKVENPTLSNPISIEKPTVSILAGTTAENIKDKVGERIKKGGFFNRFCWWTTNGTSPVPFRPEMPGKLKNELTEKTHTLIRRAKNRETVTWKQSLTDEAEELWVSFYKDFWDKKNNKNQTYAIARQPEHTVRHALIFSLLHQDEKIKWDDLSRAIEIAEYLEKTAYFVLGRFERKEPSGCQRRVLDLLRENKKMKKSDLSNQAVSYCGGEVSTLDRLLRDLEALGHIDRYKE